jgi:hypothetical protein
MDELLDTWLDEGPSVAPSRLAEATSAEVRVTHQRRATRWPAWRSPNMSYALRLAAVAAVVVAGAFIGYQLLGSSNRVGPPAVSASPTLGVSPSPSPVVSDALPPSGVVAPGTYGVRLGEHRWSFDVTAADWYSNGEGFLTRGRSAWNARPDAAMLSIDSVPVTRFGIYSDPCGKEPAPALVNPTAEEIATELTQIPGIEATEPTRVTLGGFPAQYVVLTVPDGTECRSTGGFFYLTYAGPPGRCDGPEGCFRYATVPPLPTMQKIGSTIHNWIVDVGDAVYWIQGETYTGATTDVTDEFQAIVDSLRSE